MLKLTLSETLPVTESSSAHEHIGYLTSSVIYGILVSGSTAQWTVSDLAVVFGLGELSLLKSVDYMSNLLGGDAACRILLLNYLSALLLVHFFPLPKTLILDASLARVQD
ncbi:hypothetical protein HMPREF1281_01645 [Corynebacterium sp. KPL1855]|uniref:hypothetical protein n=1 Tax=Corynebacterium sp. KPL1855 TaxID=1203562 RepID=UPI0003B88C08|nr:hypothetical protein [Corynebacterium sp. KPL1855]ERS51820.1 hypothetical protein HMPREF1281_01645 [Corynebacterium sp. KPL1855]